jgi:hypothetical protein
MARRRYRFCYGFHGFPKRAASPDESTSRRRTESRHTMSEPEPESPRGAMKVWMTLFAVECGDSPDDLGYLVRFGTEDKSSTARLGGLLFSMPEGAARHLMNNVWWVGEAAMEQLIRSFPAIGTQIEQLANDDQALQ